MGISYIRFIENNEKNVQKICVCQKKAVPLQPLLKKSVINVAKF